MAKLYPGVDGRNLNIAIYNAAGTSLLAQVSGVTTAYAELYPNGCRLVYH
jgi:hypothetical protein